MHNFLNILAQSQAANGFTLNIPIPDLVAIMVTLAGIMILIIWLGRGNPAGRLDRSPARDNCLSISTPIAVLLIWIFLAAVAQLVILRHFGETETDQLQLAKSASFLLVELCMICVILRIAATNFDSGIKGFGLSVKTILRDIPAAVTNYIAVFPLVMLGLWSAIKIAILIKGPGYEFPANETLALLVENASLPLKVMLIATAALVVPIFEEFLFRGLFQSMLRRRLESPWFAVILASVIFVVIHPEPMHWPALLPLSVCLGYAYEKSGSIIRPIIIHMIFNAVNITTTLLA